MPAVIWLEEVRKSVKSEDPKDGVRKSDHTNAGKELKKIAGNKKVYDKDTIDVPHQQIIDRLSKESGVTFERHFNFYKIVLSKFGYFDVP